MTPDEFDRIWRPTRRWRRVGAVAVWGNVAELVHNIYTDGAPWVGGATFAVAVACFLTVLWSCDMEYRSRRLFDI